MESVCPVHRGKIMWSKTLGRGHILYDVKWSILKKGKLWRQKYQWLPGSGGSGGEGALKRQSTWDSQGREVILYDAVMVGTYHYTFTQTHRGCSTNREPSGRLWTVGDDDVSAQVCEL